MSMLESTQDSAYYCMLLTWGRFVKYMKYTPYSGIDKSISYYKKKNDKNKLALSYAIKGGAIYETGNIGEAIKNLKESEKLAVLQNDIFLNYKLYGELSAANNQEGKYDLALKYAQKRLEASFLSKKRNWIATSFNQLAVGYHGLYKHDSACFYINQCIPYIDDVG